MALNASSLAARISQETGLIFLGNGGRIADGAQLYNLQPAHHPPAHTFTLHAQVGWRSVEVEFRPGNFSSELLQTMGMADASGRLGFVSVLRNSRNEGGLIVFKLNGNELSFDDSVVWELPWQNMSLSLRKGMLAVNDGDASADEALVGTWVSRLAAAVLALLPLEPSETFDYGSQAEGLAGFPEGAKFSLVVNRYERDRRNRAAALAIHGHVCKACCTDLAYRYGEIASRLIEVHHTTPVSQLGPDYVIDPETDLIPLCPNCHSVAHRRSPPYSVEELRELMFVAGSLG